MNSAQATSAKTPPAPLQAAVSGVETNPAATVQVMVPNGPKCSTGEVFQSKPRDIQQGSVLDQSSALALSSVSKPAYIQAPDLREYHDLHNILKRRLAELLEGPADVVTVMQVVSEITRLQEKEAAVIKQNQEKLLNIARNLSQ